MTLLWLLVRSASARRLLPLAAISAVLAAGTGVALTSAEIAHDTATAYPRYLDAAAVGDVVVNPGLDTAEGEAIVRSTSGIEAVASDALLTAFVNDDESALVTVRASFDGRYTRQDRPVILAGRMIEGPAEIFAGDEAARALGFAVGDRATVTFATPQLITGPGEATEIEILGTEEVEVVGIGVFADEILPDELYPRLRVLVSPELAAPYDCRASVPASDDERSLLEITAEVLPPGCTTSYRFFSLRTSGGAAGAEKALSELTDRLAAANAALPLALRENNFGYTVIPSLRADDEARVRQALEPVVLTLRIFAAAAALAAGAIALLLAARLFRGHEAQVQRWQMLGVARPTASFGLAAPAVAAVLVGTLLAAAVASFAARAGPIGSARRAQAPQFGLSTAVLVPLAAGVVVLCALVLLLARRVLAPRGLPRSRPPTRLVEALSRTPAGMLGVRAALRGLGARPLMAATVVAVGTATAASTFDANVSRLVATPSEYGWGSDVGVIVNYGYGEADHAAIAATLDRPEVQRWAMAALSGGLTVNGVALPFVGPRAGFVDLIDPAAVVRGRLPRTDAEIALGAHTARTLDVDLGEEVTVGSSGAGQTVRISGIVVLPTLGAFEADRASLGTGVLLGEGLLDRLLDAPAATAGTTGTELADRLGAFVAIDLAEDVDPVAFLAGLSGELVRWDPYGVAPVVLSDPVRPASVVQIDAMGPVQNLLTATVLVGLAAAVGAGIAAASRARRRELAIVMVLGGTERQSRRSVLWHALTVVLVGLAVGIPVGVVAGRAGYGALAHNLGLAPRSALPVASIGWIAAIAMALSVVVGWLAHPSARRTMESLRNEVPTRTR